MLHVAPLGQLDLHDQDSEGNCWCVPRFMSAWAGEKCMTLIAVHGLFEDEE